MKPPSNSPLSPAAPARPVTLGGGGRGPRAPLVHCSACLKLSPSPKTPWLFLARPVPFSLSFGRLPSLAPPFSRLRLLEIIRCNKLVAEAEGLAGTHLSAPSPPALKRDGQLWLADPGPPKTFIPLALQGSREWWGECPSSAPSLPGTGEATEGLRLHF